MKRSQNRRSGFVVVFASLAVLALLVLARLVLVGTVRMAPSEIGTFPAGSHGDTGSNNLPRVCLSVDPRGFALTSYSEQLPPASKLESTLTAALNELHAGPALGLELQLWPYFISNPQHLGGFTGCSLEARAVDRSTGRILAAWGNHTHRFGPAFLWKWLTPKLERLITKGDSLLAVGAEAQRPRLAIDTVECRCDPDQAIARAVAERLLDELLWTGEVTALVSAGRGEADYRIRGSVYRSHRNDFRELCDILDIAVVDARSNGVVLRKTFIAEVSMPGTSAYSETPLANAQAAANTICSFLRHRDEKPKPPRIVGRRDWGARKPKPGIKAMRYPGDPSRYLNWIVIHHTAYSPSGPKEVQDEHMLPRGTGPGHHPLGQNWHDVGYHFMIARDGTIYEGRQLQYIGAHAGGSVEGRNDIRLRPDFGAIGIVLFGDFRWEEPTEAQSRSLYELVHYLQNRYAIPPDHVVTHREMRHLVDQHFRALGGFTSPPTECPGRNLQRIVEQWRKNQPRGNPWWAQ